MERRPVPSALQSCPPSCGRGCQGGCGCVVGAMSLVGSSCIPSLCHRCYRHGECTKLVTRFSRMLLMQRCAIVCACEGGWSPRQDSGALCAESHLLLIVACSGSQRSCCKTRSSAYCRSQPRSSPDSKHRYARVVHHLARSDTPRRTLVGVAPASVSLWGDFPTAVVTVCAAHVVARSVARTACSMVSLAG